MWGWILHAVAEKRGQYKFIKERKVHVNFDDMQ